MQPAFLVDGVTEQKFIQLVCKNSPVKLINCNGNTVVANAIAKRVASLIRLWGGKYFPIVVLVDREDRNEAAGDFACSLVAAIRAEGIDDQLVVGVADRMIENWMLADPEVWPGKDIPACVDGNHGVSQLKKYMSTYDKASNGAVLLKKSRCSEIARRSPSFLDFKGQLAALRCDWLRR